MSVVAKTLEGTHGVQTFIKQAPSSEYQKNGDANTIPWKILDLDLQSDLTRNWVHHHPPPQKKSTVCSLYLYFL